MKLQIGFMYQTPYSDPISYSASNGTQNVLRDLPPGESGYPNTIAKTDHIREDDGSPPYNRANGNYPSAPSIGGSGGNGRWNL
jgi:hypothetical protein